MTGHVWSPWLARYYMAHGLSFSNEPAWVPPDTLHMRLLVTNTLLLGFDSLRLLFDPTQYMKPEIQDWIDGNPDLMRAIGKIEMEPPGIGVLRSVRNASRLQFPAPWSWDVGRGSLQVVGRTFTNVDPVDLVSGKAGEWHKVIFDASTELMTEAEIDGLERFIRNGGTFIAIHETGRHSPEKLNGWPIERVTGLRVFNDSNEINEFIRFTDEQTLWPSLRGKELKGWGRAMDWTGDVQTGAVGLEAIDGADVEVIARWVGRRPGEGQIAVARHRIGQGQIIVLGASFWRDSHDRGGRFTDELKTHPILGELLDSLGVPRASFGDRTPGNFNLFLEPWRSKNGLYDLYLAGLINKEADSAMASAKLQFSARNRPAFLRELSTAGHPETPFAYEEGMLTVENASFEPMQLRIYAAPRPDLEASALFWLKALEKRWYKLDYIPLSERPEPDRPDPYLRALNDDWTMVAGGERWPGEAPPSNYDWSAGRTVNLGAFETLGLDTESLAHFRKETEIPSAWRGRRVTLTFSAEYFFWGIGPHARLWINGKAAPIPQTWQNSMSFMIDMPDEGRLVFELEVDGRDPPFDGLRMRPTGVTGVFFLQADPQPLQEFPLEDWRMAADKINILTPAKVGQHARFRYLETRFRTPAGPSKRIRLESPTHLGWLILNGKVVLTSNWMRRLDVSGLLAPEGEENVLRWWPRLARERPTLKPERMLELTIPELKLAWLPDSDE